MKEIRYKIQSYMQFDPTKKPVYLFHYPFRFVKSYNHEYRTFAKKRWLGKKIIDVLAKQFQAYTEEYFSQAVLSGKITINEKKVDLNYVIKNSDLLIHSTIREEPPILDLPIEIIHEDEDFLVVSKPPSVVVHTGGGYHYNTLLAILHYEMGYQNLYVLHRIDRLTSGVVILAKKKQKATRFHEESMQEVMKKFYYARVSGDVGFDEKIVEVKMICLSHKDGIWSVYEHETMQQLAKTQQPKQSSTKFIKVWYDKQTDSSLLQCYPITGRTHQIRVHLQYLGHPMLNDSVYGGRFVGNSIINKIKQLKEQAENEKQIKDKVQKKVKQWGPEDVELEKQQIEYWKWDFKQKALEICLHSYKYRFEGKQYKSRKPYWTEKSGISLLEEKEQKSSAGMITSKYERQFLAESRRVAKNGSEEESEIKQRQQEK